MFRRLGMMLAAGLVVGDVCAPAQAEQPRSVDFDQGWRFALVNKTGITDPTRRVRERPGPEL